MVHEVVAALIIRSQRILLGQRSARREFYPGVWDVFGGHVELDEHSAIGWFSLAQATQLPLAHPTYPMIFARYLISETDSDEKSEK